MKMYLPPFDDYKGSIEILIEVVLQLVVFVNFILVYSSFDCVYTYL